MKNTVLFRALIASALALSSAFASDPVAPQDPHAKVTLVTEGQVLRVPLTELYAVQSGVGYLEVEYRKRKIQKMSEDEYAEYEKEKVGRIVMRNGRNYLIDGNHMANAAFRAGKKSMLVTYVENLSKGSQESFLRKLIEKKYCYLEKGGKAGLAELRNTVRKKVVELGDHPYRSLAWGVREVDAYEKTEEDFAEFRWARYLESKFNQTGIPASLISTDPKQAVRESLKFVHLAEAEHLPGYQAAATYTSESVEKKLKKLFD